MSTVFLYEKIYEAILSDIVSGKFQGGDILPSEKELCVQYEVSLITVRRALKQLEQDNIIMKAKGKGSVVNADIRGSQGCKNKNLGIMDLAWSGIIMPQYDPVPFNSNLYNQNEWKNIIYSAIYRKLSSKYNLIIGTYDRDYVLNHFEETVFRNVDRILVIGVYTQELIDMLHNLGKLVIVYNNFDKNIRVCSVTNDERQKTSDLVTHLIKSGHKKIASINGDITFSESVERFMGYQEALMKNNVPVSWNLIKWGNRSAESGYFLAKEWLSEKDPPTAIVCVNDCVAAGAVYAVKEMGLDCPRDISIVGHDNNVLIQDLSIPKITSIDPKYDLIGNKIADKIVRDIWLDDTTIIESEIVFKDPAKCYNPLDHNSLKSNYS